MQGKSMRLALAGLAITVAVAGAVATGAVEVAPLTQVAPGQWQLTEVGGTGTKTVCLADPAQVLQIAHGDAKCRRTVLDSNAKTVTVNYSCPGAGHGRTTLTLRSPQAFKLETQGLAGGAPFAVDYEAKRLGDCPGAPEQPANPARN